MTPEDEIGLMRWMLGAKYLVDRSIREYNSGKAADSGASLAAAKRHIEKAEQLLAE